MKRVFVYVAERNKQRNEVFVYCKKKKAQRKYFPLCLFSGLNGIAFEPFA